MNIEEAFREYREAMVQSMAAFSRDREAAEDGVSHAFAQALARRAMLEAMPEPAMKAWLYAAARNAIIDIKRRQIRFMSMTGPYDSYEFADPRPDDPAGRAAIDLLLEKLPDALRVPVELKYYSGMNAAEIGEAMNLPAATVRTRLRTAMLRLRGA
ncbi:MAG: sigma-70 family RNA polymerase sigma factor [Treponema sp.]|nr:sigma-70 family RNA polymerase sigma factor [Treponema sp.]